jgi:PAS domain S-box-containing protein
MSSDERGRETGAGSILAVDDTPVVLSLIAKVLTSAGYEVRAVESGELALAAVAASPPDLILLDVRMTGVDGLDVCRRLKAREETRKIPVILISAYAELSDWVEGRRLGAVDYITKPFQPDELLARVATHMALCRSAVMLERQSAELYQSNERLRSEVFERQRVEDELRQSLDRAERSRRAMLSALEDQTRTQQALRESEQWHRTLFERSRDALMTLAPPSWKFTSGNPAAVALFGARDEADFVSRAPWQYSPERQPDGRASKATLEEVLGRALREGASFFEWRHRRLSGEEFPATLLLTRVELEGQPILQATVRDETEKQRLQASMAQAERLASMGMLAAGVAHEINNPLSFVLYNVESLTHDLPKLVGAAKRCCGALQDMAGSQRLAEIAGDGAVMLEPETLDDVVARAEEALAGSRRIKEISRGLGTFSRVEQVERSMVDLNYAIGCAVGMAKNEIKYRARLVEDYAPLPMVLASEGKLSQVFLNLLINAAHATDEGHAEANRIGIRTWAEAGSVLAEVTDTGKGIARENLERIFEPFFTTKPVGEGSGLGLAICRNLVVDLGGELSVESEVGRGTRFVVRLPVAPDLPEQQSGAARSDGPVSVVRGRILVVDDEEEIRKMLRRMLGGDHDVVTVPSGEEACALLADDRAFDVVLCDLMMPRMSGMELHAWIAARDPALAGRVVFLTGGAFTPKASAYLESVANVRIEKPVDTVTLRAIVKAQVLEHRASGAPGPAGGGDR